MRVRGPVVTACVTGLLLAASACAAPTPTPLPACPGYRDTVLASTDFTDYSVAQAVSENGRYGVTTRDVGGQAEVSLRRTDGTAPARVIGTVPTGSPHHPLGGAWASIAPDGSDVVFGTQRWRAVDGQVSAVPVPVAADPPPGVAQPMRLAAASDDGRRLVWAEEFLDGPVEIHTVIVVTDARSDAVLGEWLAVGYPLRAPEAWLSSGGRQLLSGNLLQDLDTGVGTDLGPDAAAVLLQFPGVPFTPSAVSDDGRYVTFERYDLSTNHADTVLWDRSTGTATGVDVGRLGSDVTGVAELTDSGVVLLATLEDPVVLPGYTTRLSLVRPDGSSNLVATWTIGWLNSVTATPDLRSVVVTRATALGYQLASKQCS